MTVHTGALNHIRMIDPANHIPVTRLVTTFTGIARLHMASVIKTGPAMITIMTAVTIACGTGVIKGFTKKAGGVMTFITSITTWDMQITFRRTITCIWVMTVHTGALNHITVIDPVNHIPVIGVMTAFTSITRVDMTSIIKASTRVITIMTAVTITRSCGMIKGRTIKVRGVMTDLTIITGDNMLSTFTDGNIAIMTTHTAANNMLMID